VSSAARQLRVIDAQSGEVAVDITDGACPHCLELERDLRGKRAQLTKMRHELAQMTGVEPEAAEVLDVLEFWRSRCMPRASIVVGGERWLKVRARLREKDAVTHRRCYPPLALKGAVLGALLSEFHSKNGYLDAATIFRDSKTVDSHLGRAKTFKRQTGVSGLELLDELGSTALEWLAERCSCEHTYIEHLRGGPRPDGTTPCATPGCGCEHFDTFHAKVDRWMRRNPGEEPPA
jgi:hypothetical protein